MAGSLRLGDNPGSGEAVDPTQFGARILDVILDGADRQAEFGRYFAATTVPSDQAETFALTRGQRGDAGLGHSGTDYTSLPGIWRRYAVSTGWPLYGRLATNRDMLAVRGVRFVVSEAVEAIMRPTRGHGDRRKAKGAATPSGFGDPVITAPAKDQVGIGNSPPDRGPPSRHMKPNWETRRVRA